MSLAWLPQRDGTPCLSFQGDWAMHRTSRFVLCGKVSGVHEDIYIFFNEDIFLPPSIM